MPVQRKMSEQERGLLAAARAEREKRKAVEASLSDLKKQIEDLKNARPSQTSDKRAELLKRAPEETQKFWGEVADPVVRQTVDEEIEKRLAQYAPALEAYKTLQARDAPVHQSLEAGPSLAQRLPRRAEEPVKGRAGADLLSGNPH